MRNLQTITTLAGADPSALAVSEVHNVPDSYPRIVGVLNLASGLFQLAGLAIPKAPILAGDIDPDSLTIDQSSVAKFTAALETVADALGGC